MNIRTYIKKHGLTQSEFGKRFGYSQSMVNQWLHKRRPISAEAAVDLHKKTGGEIDRAVLRKDLFGLNA